MKYKKIPEAAKQLAMPVTLMVFGLLLLVSPDSASMIIAYAVAGLLLLGGIGLGIAALLDRRLSQIFWTLVCLSFGGALLGNPLLLARNVGRFLGILLAAAAIVVLSPMSLSRLVFSLVGAVALAAGIALLVSRLKQLRYLPKGRDDIIDAL